MIADQSDYCAEAYSERHLNDSKTYIKLELLPDTALSNLQKAVQIFVNSDLDTLQSQDPEGSALHSGTL